MKSGHLHGLSMALGMELMVEHWRCERREVVLASLKLWHFELRAPRNVD